MGSGIVISLSAEDVNKGCIIAEIGYLGLSALHFHGFFEGKLATVQDSKLMHTLNRGQLRRLRCPGVPSVEVTPSYDHNGEPLM
ncbi:hypothetical protein BC938DRAFT_471378, partial [Jimgerdemannia flammicorona]